jgi:hypothetical protein
LRRSVVALRQCAREASAASKKMRARGAARAARDPTLCSMLKQFDLEIVDVSFSVKYHERTASARDTLARASSQCVSRSDLRRVSRKMA